MKRMQFPVRIKRGSCVVTIYRTPTKGYESFMVVHYGADGTRCRKSFGDYSRAWRAARETAKSLAGGNADMLVLTGEELIVYQRAKQTLQSVGVSLDVAAARYVALTQKGNGAPLYNVAALAQGTSEPTKPKLVAEALKELLAAKAEKGRSQLYLTDLRVRLTRFANATARPLSEVTAADIDGFLRSLKVSARSQNNFRATIGTLIRFGQTRGYVHREHPCVSNVEKASHSTPEIEVFTPAEMENLLDKAKSELVPALVLGAFAGIRSEELKRLDWEDIKLKQGHIEIKSAKSKTRIRRLIGVQKNLKAWLVPFASQTGPVTPFANLALQFGKLAKISGVKWKKNGLRRSFISHRTAQSRNLAAVALESGNSAQVIARNYLKVVTRAEARKWFGIMPNAGQASNGGNHARRTPNCKAMTFGGSAAVSI